MTLPFACMTVAVMITCGWTKVLIPHSRPPRQQVWMINTTNREISHDSPSSLCIGFTCTTTHWMAVEVESFQSAMEESWVFEELKAVGRSGGRAVGRSVSFEAGLGPVQ